MHSISRYVKFMHCVMFVLDSTIISIQTEMIKQAQVGDCGLRAWPFFFSR